MNIKYILRIFKKRKRLKIFAALITLLIIAVLLFVLSKKDPPLAPYVQPKITYSQLTGLEVEPDIAERPILGVMIENSEAARPQTGLGSAGMVFEALTEGGITRYMALYQENLPETVGPVRSLRAHFLDWGLGLDVSFAHVGGSAQSLKLADERGAKSLSQFKYTEPYYRDSKRQAPHNMYAYIAKLQDQQKKLNYGKSDFAEFPRKSDSPAEAAEATRITLDFSYPMFTAQFRYDKTTNTYARFLAGKPHIDAATNKQISVKNLVVLKLNDQKAIGSGEALVFRDGMVIKAKWQMPKYDERIKIVDAQNNEISLNRGNTWFAALPKERTVTY